MVVEADVIRRLERRNGLELSCFGEMRAPRAVGIDDPFGEKVGDGIPAGRHVSCEEVIESAVFPDQDDDMFDRSLGGMFFFIWRWQWGGQSAPEADLEDRERNQALAQKV